MPVIPRTILDHLDCTYTGSFIYLHTHVHRCTYQESVLYTRPPLSTPDCNSYTSRYRRSIPVRSE